MNSEITVMRIYGLVITLMPFLRRLWSRAMSHLLRNRLLAPNYGASQ
jgi:hypothetical protein